VDDFVVVRALGVLGGHSGEMRWGLDVSIWEGQLVTYEMRKECIVPQESQGHWVLKKRARARLMDMLIAAGQATPSRYQ
jgi:hypothetical protein